MVPRWMRDALPAEPPERARTLDPRIAEAFARVRRRHYVGLGLIAAMVLGLLAWAFASRFSQGATTAGAPAWFPWALGGYVIAFVAVAAATAQSWRCPNCHRYLYREMYWPGTRIQLCLRCGVRLR